MKKVMILGAAEGQMPFLNICKSRGYEVYTVSPKGDYPCFEKADKCFYFDTRDKEKILEVAQSEKIDAIITDQTDVSVPTVAYVAEKMGLRGIGYETALTFTNKYLMRQAAEKAGVCVPKFDHASNIEDAIEIAEKIGFPLVIKPVDSSGSRGVTKIESIEELKANFELSKQYSANSDVILEQYISGTEFIVDGFALDYKYINLDIATKEISEEGFIPLMCMFSSVANIKDEIRKKVLYTNKKLVEGMKLSFGITHANYIYNHTDGNVYLVEIAARGGGVFISSDLTPLASGINTNEALIDYAVEGKLTEIKESDLKTNVSAFICFSFPDGEIISIDNVEDVKAIKGVTKVSLHDVYVGKKTKRLVDNSEKYGPILVYAENEEKCFEVVNKVRKTLDIKIKTDDGVKGLIW